jgi:hypothetical protein
LITPLQDTDESPVTLTHYVYTPAAIGETIRAFHELCDVEADVEEESTHLHFYPKSDCPVTVCDDFLNYALELSAQELLTNKE